MNSYKRFYYQVTTYLPRKLPANLQEYAWLKKVLLEAYGVPDSASTWATVAGQITSTPANKLRRAWGDIANAAKRLEINALAHEDRQKAMQALQEKLQAAMKAESERVTDEQENKEVEPQMHAEPQSEASPTPVEEQKSIPDPAA